MLDAPRTHRHEVAVLDEDGGLAFPGGVVRRRRHPVQAVLGKKGDVVVPGLAVEQLGLAVEQLLDFAFLAHALMYFFQARY